MIAFPPQARLQLLVQALLKHLPDQVSTLLASPRFAEELNEVKRLSDPVYLHEAIAQTGDAEAQWLADLLETRWRRIGEVRLDPAVAIVGPREVWIADAPREVTLHLATMRLDEGWQAEWLGAVVPAEDTSGCRVHLAPITGTAPVEFDVGVRVIGRHQGERCVLRARHRIKVRSPLLEISPDRRQLRLSDHTGGPAAGQTLAIAGRHYLTGPDGSLALAEPLSREIVVEVAEVGLSLAAAPLPGELDNA